MSGEIETKHDRIAQFLTEQHLDALVLGRLANFAWATGGRDGFIMIAAEHAAAHLIYTPDEKALVADRIEMPRFQNEEGSCLRSGPRLHLTGTWTGRKWSTGIP